MVLLAAAVVLSTGASASSPSRPPDRASDELTCQRGMPVHIGGADRGDTWTVRRRDDGVGRLREALLDHTVAGGLPKPE